MSAAPRPAETPASATAPGALVGAIAIVAGIAAMRLALGGWEAMTADHARYVYAGMSLLDGRGNVNEGGEPYILRSPAYAVLIGAAFHVAGADGAHLAAWSLGLGAMLIAVVLAARLGGPPAAVATALAVVAIPLLWDQVVSIGIDLPQAAVFLAALLLFLRPTVARWLAAGAMLGIAILVKETVAPAVVLLPIAWLPHWSGLDWRRWAGLTSAFVVAVVLTAGWWWVYVWRETGLVFPMNTLQGIVPDTVAPSAVVDPVVIAAAVVAAVVAAVSGVRLLVSRFADPTVRVLASAAVAMVPTVALTVTWGQSVRNVAIVALIGCLATGVAVSNAWRWASGRLSVPAGRAVATVLLAILLVGAALGQRFVAPASADPLPGEIAAIIGARLEPGDEVISSFRYRSALGVELFDREVSIRLIPVRAVDAPAHLSEYLWLGERGGTLFGVARSDWQAVVASGAATWVVVGTPHPLSPAELLPALRSKAGQTAGLTTIAQLRSPVGRADVYDIDPERVDAMRHITLHAQPGALLHWLDLPGAADAARGTAALLRAKPIVLARASGLADLGERLGDGACFRPRREGRMAVLLIEAAADQGDCLDPADLEPD